MKLSWQEQQKYINSSSSTDIRYRPMIIKFCLNLAAKSSSTYKDLRYDSTTGSCLFVLPSLRTIRDYKNYIKSTRGFNPDVIHDLEKKTTSFCEIERYATILLDKMKIEEDLVWDKHSDEFNGFTAFQIMPMFWKGVCYLEKTNLKVITTTADGASPKKFFKNA